LRVLDQDPLQKPDHPLQVNEGDLQSPAAQPETHITELRSSIH